MVDTWKVGVHFGKTGNLDDRFAENKTLISVRGIFETKYSRMEQENFVEDSL